MAAASTAAAVAGIFRDEPMQAVEARTSGADRIGWPRFEASEDEERAAAICARRTTSRGDANLFKVNGVEAGPPKVRVWGQAIF